MVGLKLDANQPSPAKWADWQRHEPVLDAVDFPGLRSALLNRDNPEHHKDELLGALIRLGQSQLDVDGDARMATIACLLPGLRRVVRRYQDILGPCDAWAELVIALWEQLGTYDLDRRPSRVAANLLWDPTNRLVRAVRRERAWRTHIDRDGHRPGRVEQPAEPTEMETAATDRHPHRGQRAASRAGLGEPRRRVHEQLRKPELRELFEGRHICLEKVSTDPISGTPLRHGFRGL